MKTKEFLVSYSTNSPIGEKINETSEQVLEMIEKVQSLHTHR